jgi:hypothetical protein
MSKERGFCSVFFVVLLAGLFALTACQGSKAIKPLAAAPAVAASEAVSDFNYEQAAEITAYRWQAMARAYEEHGLLNDAQDPGEISAYRWNAMAAAYEKLGLLNNDTSPGDLMAYRWLAMARSYEKNDLLNELREFNDDTVAFRWVAMARFYEKNDLLTRDPLLADSSALTVAGQD